MHELSRRQFLRLGSVSTGALLLSAFAGSPGIAPHSSAEPCFDGLVGLPQEILAETEEEVLALSSKDGLTWRDKGVEVTLQRLSSGVAVLVAAPGVPLRTIRIRWHYAGTKNSLHLGDAWE